MGGLWYITHNAKQLTVAELKPDHGFMGHVNHGFVILMTKGDDLNHETMGDMKITWPSGYLLQFAMV